MILPEYFKVHLWKFFGEMVSKCVSSEYPNTEKRVENIMHS